MKLAELFDAFRTGGWGAAEEAAAVLRMNCLSGSWPVLTMAAAASSVAR